MIIAVPREAAVKERRVALVPETVSRFAKSGVGVSVQRGAGDAAAFPDELYVAAGASLAEDERSLAAAADVLVTIGRPSDDALANLRAGSVVVGFLNPLGDPAFTQRLAAAKLTAVAMEMIPRITRAQSMDALSSQSNIAGYKAVLLAATTLPKFLPMLTTAAGTIRPATVLVLGAGVAGLQAIATARRLGAVVSGYDVRAVVKEMKDHEHIIAQGQENSARANLSFIEKAFFAANLARLHYDEDNAIILTALTIDRATLSKMLSVAGLPGEILQAVGAAKGVGRDRWYELKLLLEKPSSYEAALRVISEDCFSSLSSDDRFNALMVRLKTAKISTRAHSEPQKRSWAPEDGSLAAEMTAEGKRFTLALKARGTDAKAFGEYLSKNLAHLYEAFRQDTRSTRNGD